MNVNEYLKLLGAAVVSRELRYRVPVPPSCRGRVIVTVSEPEGLDSYARVSWSPDGKSWYWCGAAPLDDVDKLRDRIVAAIAELTPAVE